MGIFGTAVNCLVAFIVAIYVLLSKDTFKRQTKKLVSAFLPERHIQVLSSILKESDKIFGGFISGKIIDSLIIGAICFVCCLILRMPYVALISVIVGVTNVIPFFGPYIGVHRTLTFLGGICNLPWKWIIWSNGAVHRSTDMGCRVLPDKEICELSCEEERINVLLKNKL